MIAMPTYAALVLAGGAGRRLGGVDKAAVRIGERTLLDRALQAVAGAECRIVVGPRPTAPVPDVIFAREEPPGGGPVAAIEAGLGQVSADAVVVLACDMPLVTSELVDRLVDTLASSPGRLADGALLHDPEGPRQPLAAAYRTASLRRALTDLPMTSGAAMRELVRSLDLLDVPAGAGNALDCDTWEGVAACRAELARRAQPQKLAAAHGADLSRRSRQE